MLRMEIFNVVAGVLHNCIESIRLLPLSVHPASLLCRYVPDLLFQRVISLIVLWATDHLIHRSYIFIIIC